MGRKRIVSMLLAAVAVAAGSVIVVQAAIAGGRHGRSHGRSHVRSHGRSHGRAFGGNDGYPDGGNGGWFHLGPHTATPIKHVVIIFQENVSFDHYFATYPNAANTDGQTFHGSGRTPQIAGLLPATESTLPRTSSTAPTCSRATPTRRFRSGWTRARSGCPATPAVS